MKMINVIFSIAIATAVIIALSTISITAAHHQKDIKTSNDYTLESLPSKRVSRFLVQTSHLQRRSLKPADHCNKNPEFCHLEHGMNYTCCGNKCFDISNDKNHCGVCHNKCKYTYSCCNGQCVDLAYDKRHCGSCNNKCLNWKYCVYGMCDYA